MRVLFVANPEKAHLLAMAPLAWALRTAGHEVRVAGQPAFADQITRAGLTAVAVGRDADLWQLLPRDPRYPPWSWEPEYGLPTPYDVADDPTKATWRYLTDGYAEALHTWHKPACFPMIAQLVAFARYWQPDLVLWEPLALAGPIAANACGAAHGRLLWSLDVFGVARDHFLRLDAHRAGADRSDPLGDWLGGYARMYGAEFSEDLITGQFTIDQLPDSLRMAADLPYVPMRYVPYGGPAVVPKWLWDRPARPRVALTMGLSLTDHEGGYAVSVQDILDAVADLDIELVATIAESEQHRLTRVPANARLVSYVPLHALAPTCAAVINHAGFGTFLTTALYGVPQLAMPWDFDGPAFARRAAEQGATAVLPADQATGPAVRDNVLRLLSEPTFADRAGRLADEIRALPSPNQVVGHLVELTAKYRTASR